MVNYGVQSTGDGKFGFQDWNQSQMIQGVAQTLVSAAKSLSLGLGMRQEVASDGGERIVVAHSLLEGFEDVEKEEDGLACMVCHEVYILRPNIFSGFTLSARG